jgi:glutamyl-tRNA synthetase
MYCLKDRVKTFPELLEKANFVLASRPISVEPTARVFLDGSSRTILSSLTLQLQNTDWTKPNLELILTEAATRNGIGFGKLAAPLRAALAGRVSSPSVYDMMLVIGRDETIARLAEAVATAIPSLG